MSVQYTVGCGFISDLFQFVKQYPKQCTVNEKWKTNLATVIFLATTLEQGCLTNYTNPKRTEILV